MIVPQFWAEATLQQTIGQKSVSLRRFGWSDESLEAASVHAQQRLDEASEQLALGLKTVLRETKKSYNGADGVPIREEILGRLDETILTRNLYGAVCLNTPNVLFADVDFESDEKPSLAFYIGVDAILVLFGVVLCSIVIPKLWAVGFLMAVVGPMVTGPIHQLFLGNRGGAKQVGLDRIRHFATEHPEWNLRVYETPAGWRTLALHKTFQPNEPAVVSFFQAVGADPIYVRMCKNQNCFRARVSPKPWRIGINHPLRPRPGVWPIAEDKLPARAQWVEKYDQLAPQFASCRFFEALGSSTLAPEAEQVRFLHDKLCQADSNLPLA
ncbi:MAG: hypothetical protein EXS11_10740 [Gemmataceae bacterium]|nr:hypothetical protein [Gemmataceae bacterium]